MIHSPPDEYEREAIGLKCLERALRVLLSRWIYPTEMRFDVVSWTRLVKALGTPILQWDHPEARNPVSWYLFHGGSEPREWGLLGMLAEVEAIFMQPSGWTLSSPHQGDGIYFVLRGARDVSGKRGGIALFPEILRSEFHGIRAALEAYSQSKELPPSTAPACGLALQKSNSGAWQNVFEVTSKGSRQRYRLDRWD